MTTRNRDPKPPNKTGPKPKKLVETIVTGLAIGRDRKIVPPEEVQKLAAIGCKDHEISDWFGITPSSLRYNFSSELTKGRCNMKMTLRRTMFNNAVNENNTTMQIWLSKNLLGMSDNPLDSEENAPLPWKEDEDDEITTETDEEYEDSQEDQE